MAIESLSSYVAGLIGLGDRPAVIEQGLYRRRVWSYGGVIGRAFSLRDELYLRGVRPGDRVLIWGPAGAAWTVAFYGCLFAGAVAVPLDAAFSSEYAARILEHTRARVLCAPAARGPSAATAVFLSFEQIERLRPTLGPQTVMAAAPDALLELVYTSGTTGEPKGVMITHGNLLANLRPIAAEIPRYRKWARPLLPLRFVHLIPLSHLFGQVLGVFIPTLLESAVVYPESQNPSALAEILRREHASVLVAVPQQLQVLTAWALGLVGRDGSPLPMDEVIRRSRGHGVQWRWWRWRRLHRRLGWKMWAFILGGASVASDLEELWSALGYAVIQGYGLTETAPAITITHPFKIQRGSVGRKLAGVEVKIADDGEILVRGGNVSPGYYRDEEATAAAFSAGWLRTGDLGKFDERGNLIFLGRKKDVIVTAEGMNVYPEEVERALEAQPEIRESAVVVEDNGGRARVHAVLVPATTAGAAADGAMARANERLEPHQRVRAYSIWPADALPRTPSTHKLQRTAIAAWVNRQAQASYWNSGATAEPGSWRQFLTTRLRIGPERLRPEARLEEELGLSSLDRVELLSWLETHGYRAADEFALAQARTVADLERLIEPASSATESESIRGTPAGTSAAQVPAVQGAEFSYPHWPHARAVRRLRTLVYYGVVLPALRTVARLEVEGRENLRYVPRPVLFVANHQSLLDAAAIVRALPARFRPWVAPAMGADAFREYFRPQQDVSAAQRRRARRRYHLTQAFFNTYLLSEQTGIQNALRHSGWLIERGYCPLIFPEGARTKDGRLQPFRTGIGVFIRALRIPVVPIMLRGLFEILPIDAEHARRGRARVVIHSPMRFESESAEEIAQRLEAYYRVRLET